MNARITERKKMKGERTRNKIERRGKREEEERKRRKKEEREANARRRNDNNKNRRKKVRERESLETAPSLPRLRNRGPPGDPSLIAGGIAETRNRKLRRCRGCVGSAKSSFRIPERKKQPLPAVPRRQSIAGERRLMRGDQRLLCLGD